MKAPFFKKKLGKTEAQSVLYGKFKNYDTQIIFKTANSLIWAKSGLKGLIKFYQQKFHRSSKTGPILMAQPAYPTTLTRHPVTRSTGSDPTIRSDTGLRFIHLIQTGQVRFRPKPEPTRPVDRLTQLWTDLDAKLYKGSRWKKKRGVKILLRAKQT